MGAYAKSHFNMHAQLYSGISNKLFYPFETFINVPFMYRKAMHNTKNGHKGVNHLNS